MTAAPELKTRGNADIRSTLSSSRRGFAWLLTIVLSTTTTGWAGERIPADPGPGDAAPDSLILQAREAYRNGRYQAAAAAWSSAATAFSTRGDLGAQSRALREQGVALRALGAYRDALASLGRAQSLTEQTGDHETRLLTETTVALIYLATGQPKQAEEALTPAARDAETLGKPSLAPVLNGLGDLRLSQDRLEEALRAYETGLRLASQAQGQPLAAAEARIGAARAWQALGDRNQSETALDDAIARLQPLPASSAKAYALLTAGQLLHRLAGTCTEGQRAKLENRAYQAFDAARGTAEQIEDQKTLAYAFGYLGELYRSEQRYPEAISFLRRAIFSAQQAQAPESLYRWQWQLGRVLAAQGEIDGALSEYRQAVYQLRTLRQDMVAGGGHSLFRQQVGPVYFELADLLLRKAALESDQRPRNALLLEARAVIEQLKAAELRDYFQDACVADTESAIAELDRIANDTAVVYPVLLPDRTALLLSLPSGMRQFVVPVDRETLTAEVRRFRQRLEKRTTSQFMIDAQRLYDWLIRPMEPALQEAGIKTLVFVPDGPLRTVPMAALHDGKSFLIENFAVATTPGLTLTDPKVLESQHASVLLNALTEPVQGFPPLPNAEREAEAVRALYTGTTLENREFVLGNLQRELEQRPYTVVHIASHGQFKGDVRKTFLLTYDDRLSMDQLEQFMHLSRFREEPVELLTLSACQSAAGDDRAALGLAGVAVKAGARSALATLWFINDQASADLIAAFYAHLNQAGTSKARALQLAQLEAIADPRYRHPSYWSPFLLIGNWL